MIGSALLTLLIGILIASVSSPAGERSSVPMEELPVLSRQAQPLCPDSEQLSFFQRGSILQVPQDFPTIQAAIDAAPEWATIQLSPGTYTENLVIRKSVRLRGVARDHVVLKSAHRNWSAILIVSGYGMSIHEPLMVVIENLTIAESPVGIELIGVPSVVVQYNTFRDNGTSILTLATTELLPFSARGGGAIICRNIFEDGTGIYAVPRDQHHLWIIDNSFRNLYEGIRIEKSHVRGQGTEPLRVIFPRVLIQKNTMEGIRSWGVILLDSAGVMIERNIIEGSDKFDSDGVVVSGSEAILESNVIRSHRGVGVRISAGELLNGRALLKGNKIENNGRSEVPRSGGVVIIGWSSRTELIENRIADNVGWGILIGSIWSVEVCQGNQVVGNGSGDYGWYSIHTLIPQPSPELKQKCEGG